MEQKGGALMTVKPKNRAFTLVELLMAIIIIGILSGMMMFAFGSAFDSSKKSVCAGNRRAIRSGCLIADAENRNKFAENITEVMKQFPKAAGTVSGKTATYTGLCPAGGTYTIVQSGDKVLVACDKHADAANEPQSDFPLKDNYGDKIAEIIGKLQGKEKLDALKELIGYTGSDANIRNDTLRKALLAKIGGKWPEVDKSSELYNGIKDMLKKDNVSSVYIQPYLLSNGEAAYWISKGESDQGGWRAYAIYYKGSWYKKRDNSTTPMWNVHTSADINDAYKNIIKLTDSNGNVLDSWTKIN